MNKLIPLIELLCDAQYKKLSKRELIELISLKISFEDRNRIPGDRLEDKYEAINLLWNDNSQALRRETLTLRYEISRNKTIYV